MKRRQWDTTLYDLADAQAGYFTAAQARNAGVLQVRLSQLHHRGDVERVTRGVYRLTRYPISPLGQYMQAALWPQVRRPDAHGVISHQSALAIYGLSDASPAKVHLTLPTGFRIRRTPPKHLVLHYADLTPGDEQRVEGVPVTTAARAIRDAHKSHLGPALIRQAIADGRRTGHLTFDEADALERELLGNEASPQSFRAIPKELAVMARRPPTGLPSSVGVLAKYVQAYAREGGLSEGRVRGWISYMVMAGALERAAAGGQPRFIVKGGIALELRLRNRARATKEIDVVLQHDDADLARTLERAMTGEAYQGFTFRRKGEPLLLDNGTVNLELAVSYRGGAWTTITVDIARAEPGESEIEWLRAIPLMDDFGIAGPADLPCLPLRFHIAQKLHGMTLPSRSGKRNERFRDLIDLLLMEELVTDYQGLREACEAVFRSRGTHDWPPPLVVPAHWIDPFARLAEDLDLPVPDANAGMTRVQAFVTRILQTELDT